MVQTLYKNTEKLFNYKMKLAQEYNHGSVLLRGRKEGILPNHIQASIHNVYRAFNSNQMAEEQIERVKNRLGNKLNNVGT